MWLSRHRTLVMAVGMGVTAVVLVLTTVWPIYQSTRNILSKIGARTRERDDLVSRVSILSKLDYNVLAERVRLLDAALPPKKDVLLYLASINGLSNELGLSFGGINLAPGELSEASGSAQKNGDKIGLSSLESEIKIQGGKESIYAFMRKIEEVMPLMQIKDIKVTVVTQEQYALSLTLGMLWAETSTVDVKGPVTIFGDEEEKYFQQLATYREYPGIASQAVENQTPKLDLFAAPILQP